MADDEERAVERAGGIFGTIERLRRENATLTARVAALTLAVEEGRAIVARFVGYLDGRIIAGDMFYDLVDSLECYVAGSTPAIRAALAGTRDGEEDA